MKGLDLAEAYYRDRGRPLLAEWFADDLPRIAVGLVGEGSECFGFDDELSRDHDWGPGFCMWLTAEDYARIGANLQDLYDSLPGTYGDFGPRVEDPHAGKRTGVFAIPEFYARFIRYDHVPTSLAEWRTIPETHLATATNGRVFIDPLGEFTAFREGLLAFYPEDVRLKKLAARCAAAGQAGQYNYGRCLKRGETVAAQCALGLFVEAVASIVYLLNKRYRPFYKWMHQGMKDLPVLGDACHRLLADLCSDRVVGDAAIGAGGREGSEKTPLRPREQIIEEISSLIISALRAQGLSSAESDFLLDHAWAVQSGIENQAYRALHVMME